MKETENGKKFLSDEDRDLLREGMLKDFTAEDQRTFFRFVEKTELDPFTRQIHAMSRLGEKDQSGRRGPNQLVIVTGIGGFLWVAERTGLYDGDDPAEWCDKDGQWRDVWTDELMNPVACRVKTYRKDHNRPSVSVVNWNAVAQYKPEYVNGKPTGEKVPNVFWHKSGPGQLAKCALAASLRKLFPSQLAGVYEHDEIPQMTEEETEAANFNARTKASEDILKTNGHVNRVDALKEVPEVTPEDMEDAIPMGEPPVQDVHWWKIHVIQEIGKWKGKTVKDLSLHEVIAALNKWVPKVGLRDRVKADLLVAFPEYNPEKLEADPAKPEAWKLTAEAFALYYIDHITAKAKESLL